MPSRCTTTTSKTNGVLRTVRRCRGRPGRRLSPDLGGPGRNNNKISNSFEAKASYFLCSPFPFCLRWRGIRPNKSMIEIKTSFYFFASRVLLFATPRGGLQPIRPGLRTIQQRIRPRVSICFCRMSSRLRVPYRIEFEPTNWNRLGVQL